MDISLIIACYNEELLLEESVQQVLEVLESTCWTYELIFVDDCSQDRTRDIILDLVQKYPSKKFRYLFHEHNHGRGRTVVDGFRMASGNVVGYIDIDLEVHARYIPSMVTAISHGADIATAYRVYKVDPRIFHRFVLSRGYIHLVQGLLNISLQDTETGFKFFRRDKLIPVLELVKDEGWFWDTEIMAIASILGYQIVEIPCLFLKRFDKKSSVNVVKDTLDYIQKLWTFRLALHQIRQNEPSPQLTTVMGD